MIKYIRQQILCISILSVVFAMPAMAQWDIPGTSCNNPVELTETFSMDIPIGGSYWLTAWTYDLPVHARYVKNTANIYDDEVEPYVLIDFSCVHGEYDDPNIEELINSGDGWGVEVPVRLEFEFIKRDYDNDVTIYELSVSEEYRQLMMKYGITYDVKAFVNVVLPRGGTIELVPETEFRKCAESATWLSMNSETEITAQTMDVVYALPVTEWRLDSVRFRWTGSEKAQLWMGGVCEFELTNEDENVLDIVTFNPAGTEGSYVDYSSEQLLEMVNSWGDGSGLFYARILSAQPGEFIIEPKPIEGPMADAIELQIGEPVTIHANDTNQVYYFRKTWRYNTMQFLTNATDSMTAYFGNDVGFKIAKSDRHYIDSLNFVREDERMVLNMTLFQMRKFTLSGETDFTFVRFSSPITTELTPTIWNTGKCFGEAVRVLNPNDKVMINTSTTSTHLYPIELAAWAENDVTFRWSTIYNLEVYLADTCDFNQTPTNKHVLFYKMVNPNENGEIVFTKEMVQSYIEQLGDQKHVYFRLKPRGNGTLYTRQEQAIEPVVPIELHRDEAITLAAEDTTQVYYFPKTWGKDVMQFVTNATDSMTAYFGISKDFYLAPTDSRLIDSLRFVMEDGRMVLNLTAYQMDKLTTPATSDHVYVRFSSAMATDLTPTLWVTDDCMAQSVRVLDIQDKEYFTTTHESFLYPIHIAQWAKGDMTLRWQSETEMHVYLADACEFYLAPDNMHVLYYQEIKPWEEEKMVILQDTLTSIVENIEGEYAYIRFRPMGNGVLYVSQSEVTNPPTHMETAIEEGIYVRYVDGQVVVYVDRPQTLYLYNTLGVLVRTWQQEPTTPYIIEDLPNAVYVLKGNAGAMLLRK